MRRKLIEKDPDLDFKEMSNGQAVLAGISLAAVFWVLVILGIMLPPLM